jgi:hypothetical protein
MTHDRSSRFVALFLLGCVVFNEPLLNLFSTPELILGVPRLYCYLFGVWLLMIALIARLVRVGK